MTITNHKLALSWCVDQPAISRPALFVDRDGVINRKIEGGYVLQLPELEILDLFVAAAKPISDAGVPIVIVTNQSCVGRGLIDRRSIRRLMFQTVAGLRERGVRISGFLCCPHAPEAICDCRKPKPGLFRLAERQFNFSLADSVFIGDQQSDLVAGSAAGVTTFIVDVSDAAEYRQAFSAAASALQTERSYATA